jgi:hypothetical protein
MRPPYGDIDDRVRAICAAMGITPIVSARTLWTPSNMSDIPLSPQIWTGLPDGTNFDTDDWKIFGGTATGQSSVAAFDKILEDASKLDTGFIVLEHDLYQQSVDLAVGCVFWLVSRHSAIAPDESLYQLHPPFGPEFDQP